MRGVEFEAITSFTIKSYSPLHQSKQEASAEESNEWQSGPVTGLHAYIQGYSVSSENISGALE